MSCTTIPDIKSVPIERLHEVLRLAQPCALPAKSLKKSLHEWRMEEDDAQILSYLYRQLQPRRHLEFGTWQGAGAVVCLENCNATVWTLNLLNGQQTPEGEWSYYTDTPPGIAPGSPAPESSARSDFSGNTQLPGWVNTKSTRSGKTLYQTDALGFVGRLVHERGYGHRLCQIYCDSRDWDVSNYPKDFFDTVLIDGGHEPEVVASDTRKALSVLRPGGVVMWHDYCLDSRVLESCSSVQGVVSGVESAREWLTGQCEELFWLRPSWLLLGVNRGEQGGGR